MRLEDMADPHVTDELSVKIVEESGPVLPIGLASRGWLKLGGCSRAEPRRATWPLGFTTPWPADASK